MQKLCSTMLLTCAVACAIGPSAMQGVTVLTFEGLSDQESISNFYNGGMGGSGSGPGPNYGITFTPDSLVITSDTAGGTGNFDGNPSGNNIAFFLAGAGDTMNVSSGFTTGFSFDYSAPFFPGTVNVYGGSNGTGALLTSLSLPQTTPGKGTAPCNTTDDYCPWMPFGVTFSGTAMSVVFTGNAKYIGFDDITLGSATPGGSAAPEPSSLVLLGMGAGALGLVGRSSKKTPRPKL